MSRDLHKFIFVDVLVDGTTVGGNETFMRVQTQTACKKFLATFIEKHANAYHPLPDGAKVSLMCVKISDTDQGRPATDVGYLHDCSVFLDILVDMAMREVPTKRFSFKYTSNKNFRCLASKRLLT